MWWPQKAGYQSSILGMAAQLQTLLSFPEAMLALLFSNPFL